MQISAFRKKFIQELSTAEREILFSENSDESKLEEVLKSLKAKVSKNALNIETLKTIGTIEARHMNSTMVWETIDASTDFHMKLIEFVSKNPDTSEDWLKNQGDLESLEKMISTNLADTMQVYEKVITEELESDLKRKKNLFSVKIAKIFTSFFVALMAADKICGIVMSIL